MNRRKLLMNMGAAGMGAMIPLGPIPAAAASAAVYGGSDVCWLTTALTEGPYYFNPNLVRQDIRTDSTRGALYAGVPLTMTFTIVDINCAPVSNVLVDIWHCNKDGNYSGYSGQPGGNFSGYDFMRGIQMTDTNGRCTFTTSYPGWYQGRATHIHFKVRMNSTTYVTSQFAFLESVSDAVHRSPLYASRGISPTRNATDGVFAHLDLSHHLMSPVANTATGGYAGAFTIGIAGLTTGANPGFETPTQFTLRQNYPNPFNPTTTIEYYLPVDTNAKLVVYDVLGLEVAKLVDREHEAGMHRVVFDAASLGSGFYFYKLIAGSFVTTREMLFMK